MWANMCVALHGTHLCITIFAQFCSSTHTLSVPLGPLTPSGPTSPCNTPRP